MAQEMVNQGTGEIKDLPAMMDNSGQSLAVQLAMAELNQDVITARSFPRSVARVFKGINELVAMDEQSAKECVYAVPRDGKTIRGPSIRLAEIIASQWGNCHCASRVVHVDRIEKYVESEGIFHDLETGLKRTARTRKSIAKRDGGIYSQDMIMTAGNAAASIAMREAILKGVPKAVWRNAFEHAENVIRGDVTTLVERREQAMKALTGLGATPDRIFAAIGVAGKEEIGLDELADLFAMYQGVKNGDSDIDQIFPAVTKGEDGKAGPKSTKLNDRLDKLAGGDKAKPDKAEAKKGVADKGETDVEAEQAAKDKAAAAEAAKAKEKPKTDASQSEPSENEAIAKARKMGVSARRKGINRKALPPELKAEDREAERDAWLEGYDAEAAKEAEAGGQ